MDWDSSALVAQGSPITTSSMKITVLASKWMALVSLNGSGFTAQIASVAMTGLSGRS